MSGNIIHTKHTVGRKNHKGFESIAKDSYCLKTSLGDTRDNYLYLVSSLKLVTYSDPHTPVAYEGWFGTGVASSTIHSNDYVEGE